VKRQTEYMACQLLWRHGMHVVIYACMMLDAKTNGRLVLL